MIALAATLVLWLSHDAVAQGDLARLERFADHVQLDVSAGTQSNLISDSAAHALAVWPAVVGVELRPPLATAEALQLRKIPRIHAILLGADPGKTLSLLGPALVLTSVAPAVERELAHPCGNVRVVQLAGGARRFEVTGRVDACVIAALEARVEAVVPLVAGAQGVQRSLAEPPAPTPEPLAAEPLGPAALVLVEVEGAGPEAGRLRALVKTHLVGRTLTGVSLPWDGLSGARVLARAQVLPLEALGKEVAQPRCTETPAPAQVVWRLLLETERPAKGRVKLKLMLSSLQCAIWAPFADSEAEFKSEDAALGAAVGLAEGLLARGKGGGR